MNIRRFNKEDYDQVLSWAKAREVNYPPLDFLSDLGLIIDNKCACFIYTGNSKVCLIEALISNPSISKEERNDSLILLFNEMEKICKEKNCKYINCVIETESLKEPLKKFNMLFSDKPTFVGLRVL